MDGLRRQDKAAVSVKLFNLLDFYLGGRQVHQSFLFKERMHSELKGGDIRLSSNNRKIRKEAKRRIKKSDKSKDEQQQQLENLNLEKPSKRLLLVMLAEQRQKNQEMEDDLRLIKLKLQQETKAKREMQLQVLRKDNNNNELKKASEMTLQEFSELQAMWEAMGKTMSTLEQLLFEGDAGRRGQCSFFLSFFFFLLFSSLSLPGLSYLSVSCFMSCSTNSR